MTAWLLTCVLSLAQGPETDPLLKQLDADFKEALKQERDAPAVRKAARLLAGTNQSSNWTDYNGAVTILRQTRARAGIPLLLKYMVLHAGFSTGHVVIPAYADTLTYLTGKDFPDPYRAEPDRVKPVRAAVEQWVKTWWLPQMDKLTTEVGKMSPEQVRRVTNGLLAKAGEASRQRSYGGTPTVSGLAYALAEILQPGREGYRIPYEEEVHPAMLPPLLEAAGHVDAPRKGARPERDKAPIRFEVVPLLAALRQDGEAPALEKIARDPKQSSATRLASILALYRAGEDMPTEVLLGLLEGEKKIERRLVTILALQYCRAEQLTTPRLVALLDDSNNRVRTAAVIALQSTAPKEALPKLKKILDERHPQEAVHSALTVVANMGTREATATLAEFLESSLRRGARGQGVYYALGAFETATGMSWIEAGAHNDAYYRAKAAEALKWWKAQK